MKTPPRFDSVGRCNLCSGGWLCKACQDDGAARDRARSAVLRDTARGIRCQRVADLCARHELESDETGSRENRAARMLGAESFRAYAAGV